MELCCALFCPIVWCSTEATRSWPPDGRHAMQLSVHIVAILQSPACTLVCQGNQWRNMHLSNVRLPCVQPYVELGHGPCVTWAL